MLSGLQLSNFLKGKVKIIRYIDLKNITHIDQIFTKNNVAILLYPSLDKNNKIDHDTGHWVTVFKNGNTIFYFDSYGQFPESPLKDFGTLNYFKEGERYMLSELLYNSNYNIDYNDTQYQNGYLNGDPEISTCGWWVLCRILLRHLDNDNFYDIFSRENNPGKNMDHMISLFVKNPRKFKI
jgi:hypothetical protein